MELTQERLDLFVFGDVVDALAATVACIDVCTLADGGLDHACVFALDSLVKERAAVGALCIEVDYRVSRQVEKLVDLDISARCVLLIGGEQLDELDIELSTAHLDLLSDFGCSGDCEGVFTVLVEFGIVNVVLLEQELDNVVSTGCRCNVERSVAVLRLNGIDVDMLIVEEEGDDVEVGTTHCEVKWAVAFLDGRRVALVGWTKERDECLLIALSQGFEQLETVDCFCDCWLAIRGGRRGFRRVIVEMVDG